MRSPSIREGQAHVSTEELSVRRQDEPIATTPAPMLARHQPRMRFLLCYSIFSRNASEQPATVDSVRRPYPLTTLLQVSLSVEVRVFQDCPCKWNVECQGRRVLVAKGKRLSQTPGDRRCNGRLVDYPIEHPPSPLDASMDGVTSDLRGRAKPADLTSVSTSPPSSTSL